MSEITKYVPPVQVIDDLKEPQLGTVVKDGTALMFLWGAIGISAALYIPVFGWVSALPIWYMGFRDIQALTGKQKNEKEDGVGHNTQLNAIEVQYEAHPEYTEPNPWTATPRHAPNLGIQPQLPEQTDYADPYEEARATGQPVGDVLQKAGYNDDMIRSMGHQVGAAVVDSIQRPPATVFEDKPVHQPFDIAAYLAANPQPFLMTAPPRTGKGIVVAQMIREFKKRHPGSVVWVLQPKYHPDEWGYWKAADRVWGDMPEIHQGNKKEMARITGEWEKFIHDWRALPQRPKLMLIDEGVKISALAKRWFDDFLVSTVKTEASSGETDNRFLGFITQSALVSDIGMSGGDRGCLSILCLAKPDKKQHLKSFLRSFQGEIQEPDEVLYEASGSPKRAIVYCSELDEWYPLPEYPVYQATEPHPNNAAQKPEVTRPQQSSYDSQFTEPSPWENTPADTGWEFEADLQTPIIEYPEITGKAEQLKANNDPRLQCAGEFLEALIKLGDGTQVSPSDIGKTSWASRWANKNGGLNDRSTATLAPFLRNGINLGFLTEDDGKYRVSLK